MQNRIILNNHILTRFSPPASILIFTRFQTDSIIPRIKKTISDQYVFTRLHIQRIAILRIPGIEHLHIVQSQRFARQRMDTPARWVLESHPFQQNPFALYYTQHDRAQPAFHVSPLFIGYFFLPVILSGHKYRGFQSTRIRIPYLSILIHFTTRTHQIFPLPFRHLVFLDRTPSISCPIENTIAGDGYIFSIHCRNRRLAALSVQPFERSVDNGI